MTNLLPIDGVIWSCFYGELGPVIIIVYKSDIIVYTYNDYSVYMGVKFPMKTFSFSP